jgi:hypothetical protein
MAPIVGWVKKGIVAGFHIGAKDNTCAMGAPKADGMTVSLGFISDTSPIKINGNKPALSIYPTPTQLNKRSAKVSFIQVRTV